MVPCGVKCDSSESGVREQEKQEQECVLWRQVQGSSIFTLVILLLYPLENVQQCQKT